MARVVAPLDLDAFFAAVEVLERPELAGLPLVVGGSPDGRGVVSTASYEARAFGIRSAMSAAEARRRCPQAVFVRPSMARYSAWSRRVWALVDARVPLAQQVGIDEGYLDLNGAVGTAGEAEAVPRGRRGGALPARPAGRDPDGDGPRRVVRLRHVEGGGEDRLRPPQAARRHRRAGRARGGVPGAAAVAGAAGRRAEVGRAAAAARPGADRRPRGAVRRAAGGPAARH